MVYEALKGADGQLDAAKPIDVYWLDIDPAYVEAARKKGIKSDRNDVSGTHIASPAASDFGCRAVCCLLASSATARMLSRCYATARLRCEGCCVTDAASWAFPARPLDEMLTRCHVCHPSLSAAEHG